MVVLRAILILLYWTSFAGAAWTPILGIPEPDWGVTQVSPSLPDPWTSDTTGFYFVQAGGTNSGNGYPSNPRGSMPSSPPAGSVICLNGSLSITPTIGYTGTSGSPIFIRSYNTASKATITAKWVFQNAAYVIFEDINADWTGTGKIEIYTSSNLSIRDNDLKGDSTATGGIILQNTSLTDYGQLHHIVIDNNTIRECGDWQTAEDQDCHGVTSGATYIEDVWITNNTFYHLSGDAVQIGKNAYNSANSTRRYYVGNNVAYETKQAAFWSKGASDVIFSSNIAHDLRDDNASGDMSGFGAQYGPEYIWFINNITYDSPAGVAIEARSGGTGEHVYIIGNLFYGIHDTGNTRSDWTNPETGVGSCMMNRGAPYLYLVNNTFHDYDSGIQIGMNSSTVVNTIVNNIFSSRNTSEPGYDFLSYAGDVTLLDMDNNDFYTTMSSRVGSTTYTGFAALDAAMGNRTENNITDDPLFVSTASDNYALQESSPAKDAGIVADVYATFYSRYGISIAEDISGADRPQGAAWDIGAYEYREVQSLGTVLLGHQ